MTTDKTLELVRAYYDCWPGAGQPCDVARLRTLLHPKLNFESPSGKRDKVEDLLPGIERFTKTLKTRNMQQLFGSGAEAAAVYDCELTGPVDSLRCTEVFRVEGEQIVSIRLVFDATGYRLQAAS